jgi:hypothetical protein
LVTTKSEIAHGFFNHDKAAAPDQGAALAKLDVESATARQAGLSELAIVAEFRTRVENCDRSEIKNKPLTAQGFSVEKGAAVHSIAAMTPRRRSRNSPAEGAAKAAGKASPDSTRSPAAPIVAKIAPVPTQSFVAPVAPAQQQKRDIRAIQRSVRWLNV